ncbi:MAG: hypothetical protein O3A38_06395, partial [Proteobacteria bacterium]|nr:hypothetical protein [Pseudomonadota bacterium]
MAKVFLGLVLLLIATGAARADGSSAGGAQLYVDDIQVESDGDKPRACIVFNQDLAGDRATPIETYLRLEPQTDAGFSVRRDMLCIEGLRHGQDYDLTLLAGLPGGQSVLAEDQTLRLAVPDRDPATRFPGTGFVLPRVEHAGLPVETVNVDTLEVCIYRVNDRAL